MILEIYKFLLGTATVISVFMSLGIWIGRIGNDIMNDKLPDRDENTGFCIVLIITVILMTISYFVLEI